MRRLAGVAAGAALLVLAAACARQGFPPGGPPRFTPPEILTVFPESGAVNVSAKAVSIVFDEVVSEKPATGQTIADIVLISPRDGGPRVAWHRTKVDIRGQKPWRPNTAYTITLRPGITDLHGNVLRRGTVIVFSTGAVIPSTVISGVVFDWGTGKPVPAALVQSFLPPDSSQYVTLADSTGRFTLGTIPPGAINVRAVADANGNRALDPHEAWDSVTVTLKDSATAELYVFVHDSTGPRINSLDVRDSLTLRVGFDKPLDVHSTVDTSNFTLRAMADSQIVPLRFVRGWAAYDKARTDSIARADSLAALTDTAVKHRLAARAALDSQVKAQAQAQARPKPPRGALADTTPPPPPPVPSRAIPLSDFAIVLAKPLVPGAWYKLQAHDVKNLLGDTATSQRTVQMPKPAPKPVPKPAAAKPGAPPPPAPARDSTPPPAKPPRP